MLRCIRAENRKLRGAVLWLAFLIVPIFPAVMGTFNYLNNLGLLQSEWYSLWTQHTLFYATFFYAPLIGVYCSYLWRLEHMGHNWNLIMTTPVRPFALYFAKFAVACKVTLLTQAWVFVLYLALGKLVAGLPGLPPPEILWWCLRGTLGALPVIALQLIFSMVMRSFAAPVLIALGGNVLGLLTNTMDLGLFWPYALMIVGMNSNQNDDMLAGGMAGFAVSTALFLAVFFLLAQQLLTKRDVKAE